MRCLPQNPLLLLRFLDLSSLCIIEAYIPDPGETRQLLRLIHANEH